MTFLEQTQLDVMGNIIKVRHVIDIVVSRDNARNALHRLPHGENVTSAGANDPPFKSPVLAHRFSSSPSPSSTGQYNPGLPK